MRETNRLKLLGRGVFERADIRKKNYILSSLNDNKNELIDLSLGSSDLKPPIDVINAIKKSLVNKDSSSYCLQAQTKPFRESVASWCKNRFGVSVDPEEEVLFLIGSQEGTAHLPLAVLDPGQVGVILDPSYPSHRGGMVLAGAHVEKLLLRSNSSWEPNFSLFSASELEQIKLMILGYPHNPTTTIGSQETLDQAIRLGLKYNFVVANDNPYVDLALEGKAPALLLSEGWKKCGVEFFSFSKAWSLGGFRLGFAVGAKPIISALKQVKGFIDFNQSLSLQASFLHF